MSSSRSYQPQGVGPHASHSEVWSWLSGQPYCAALNPAFWRGVDGRRLFSMSDEEVLENTERTHGLAVLFDIRQLREMCPLPKYDEAIGTNQGVPSAFL